MFSEVFVCPQGSQSRSRGSQSWRGLWSRGVSSGGLCSKGLCPGVSVQWGLCPGRSLSGSLCPGGSLSRGSLSREISVWRVSVQGVGLCPGGGSLSRGWISVQGVDLCPGDESLSRGWVLCPGRGSLSGRPPYGKEWVVRILLECILVGKFEHTVSGLYLNISRNWRY